MTIAVKLNHWQLLAQLADANSSGCLEIDSESVSWKIYLDRGNLLYVQCSIQTLEQIEYHLHYFGWQKAATALKKLPKKLLLSEESSKQSEPADDFYGKVISWLISQQHLDSSQVSKLIQNISKYDLFHYLWLEESTSLWQENCSFPNWITEQIKSPLFLEVSGCLKEAEKRQRQRQSCSAQLSSIYQRPYFPPSWETKPLPASGSLNRNTLIQLTQVLRGRTSIRQLSILLNKDEFKVAKILSPYIDEKIIYLHHAQAPLDQLPCIPRNIFQASGESSPNSNKHDVNQAQTVKKSVKTQKIVCIDDSPTILSEIQRFLDQEKFEITAINDPVQAVSKIFTINPDLILLDITMPRISGYKLCGLLRSSGKCDDTPIIMVTGNTGLIDKARAKLSGATDYFTKPFTKDGLNTIVAKYLP